MTDWVNKLDGFLKFNDYDILQKPGTVAHEVAKKLAETEYQKYRVVQDQIYESDFDQEVKKITGKADDRKNIKKR